MAFNWSKNQIDAIQSLGCNVLVSAGAGSGKTAVLTERIFQLVKSGKSLSKFLVLTFTNAAASEMKIRLRDKLLSHPETSHLTSELEASHIETFDAFCLYLVKKYSQYLSISSDISIMDSSLLAMQKQKIIDQVFDEYYLEQDPLFVKMINAFCLKNDLALKDFVNRITCASNLKIDQEAFWHYLAEECYEKEHVLTYINAYYQEAIKAFKKIRKMCETLSDLDDSNCLCAVFDQAINAKNYDHLIDLLESLSLPNKKKNYPEEDKHLRQYITDFFSSWKKRHFGHSEDIYQGFIYYQPYAKILIAIAKAVEERFLTFKKQSQHYGFSDIARMALEVIDIPMVREEIKQSFDYIMVDEYQDTSDVQEQVIQALSQNNLYMVGDVKQSIYRFRNANCQIFQDKFNSYKKNISGKEIDLNVSFRSRYQIIEFINELFSKIMTPENNIINYQDGHHFVYEPVIYGDSDKKSKDYQPLIYRYEGQKSEENIKKEIAIIADDVLEKINSQYQILDKDSRTNTTKMRPVRFSDFAIIVDRGSDFDEYHRQFSSLGIPLSIIRDEKIDNSMLGYVTKNLIKLFNRVANNQLDDEFNHAYVAIARSFLLSIPDQDIYTIVKQKLFLHTDLYQKIEKVVGLTKDKSLFEILRALYEEFDIYQCLIKLDRCNDNIELVETFLSFTKSMDDLGYSISELSAYFEDLAAFDLDVKVPRQTSHKDAVTLITIHRSKGLEYPIVYLSGLFKKFNRDEIQTSFLVSPLYGISFPMPPDYPFENFANYLIKERVTREDFEEKLRLFYVAVTRVREKLIFLYPQKAKPSFLVDLREATSFKDFLDFLEIPEKCGCEYEMKNAHISVKNLQKALKKIEIKQISLPSQLIEKRIASHEISEEVDQGVLDFGTQLHQLLEVVDYEKKDLSFIRDKRLAQCVSNVFMTSLFSNVKNENLRHEFKFYDAKNQIHGVIDCLIMSQEEIKIVDFKLKNIDDEQYIKQLHAYRDYVRSISALPIRMYLISAMTGEEREIE